MPWDHLRLTPLALCLGIVLALPRETEATSAVVRGAPPVTNCADSGAGSLRDAVAAAVSGDTIDMTSLGCSEITLTTGAIQTNLAALTLRGPPSPATRLNIRQSPPATNPVLMQNTAGGTFNLYDLELSDGNNVGIAAGGGCLYSAGSIYLKNVLIDNCRVMRDGGGVWAGGTLEMQSSDVVNNTMALGVPIGRGGGVYARGGLIMGYSTVSYNAAEALATGSVAYGGGAFTQGSADISHSTISGNVAGGRDGPLPGSVGGLSIAGYAAYAHIVDSTISGNHADSLVGGVYTNTPLTLSNSTIAFNTATNSSYSSRYAAGGVHVYQTSAVLESTILAHNTAAGTERDLEGYFADVTGAANLIMSSTLSPPGTLSADPMLLPIAANGGRTPTHALAAGSPAIDQGNNLMTLASDQRGPPFVREFGSAPDIGAFEVQEQQDEIFANGFDP